ncbi:hypothetical protein SELMODRAFT_406856 [Selaginella moellendorffii]|uniref:Uncharacterized protein n=1 Tax=Selaginella moellendorffii TaxID=88036 RepID=D8R356_SELML|nr:hypothetical protein SELMODRAFT_406856 [Selaginella moellendorffii]
MAEAKQHTGSADDGGAPELSAHTPATPPPPSSASSPHKELQQLQLELRLLEALEIYHPSKLQGIHRHFILYGLMEFLEKRLNRHFSAEEILQTLNGFYNLELLKPDDEEVELASHQEDFSLPSSVREDPKDEMTLAAMKGCGQSCTKDEECKGKLACVGQTCGDDPDMETQICGPSQFPKGCSKPCKVHDDCPGKLACMDGACGDDPAMETHICSKTRGRRPHPPKAAPAPESDSD